MYTELNLVKLEGRALKGDKKAAAKLGRYFEDSNDLAHSFKWYLLAAEMGNLDAQCIVGFRLLRGQGVTKDIEKGLEWHGQAGMDGDAVSCVNMFWCNILNRLSVETAIEWLRRAAKYGSVFSIGIVHLLDLEVEKQATAFGKQSQRLGQANLELKVGTIKDVHSKSKNLEGDEKCNRIFSSSETEYAMACFELAVHYFLGIGVPNDFELGKEMLLNSAKHGHLFAEHLISTFSV